MAWLIVDSIVDGGITPPPPTQVTYPVWYILPVETVTIPERQEMALHGEFLNEGTLVIETNARLRLEP